MPHVLLQKNNPYTAFGMGDKLFEYNNTFNKLTKDEQNQLARNLVLDCPEKELKLFSHQANALVGDFKTSLVKACEARLLILALTDERQHNIASFITREFNAQRFGDFLPLAQSLFKGREDAIAAFLVKKLPVNERADLVEHLSTIFPSNDLQQKVNAQSSQSAPQASAASAYSFHRPQRNTQSTAPTPEKLKEEEPNTLTPH